MSKKLTLAERLEAIDDFAVVMKQRVCEEEQQGRDEWDRWKLPHLITRIHENASEVSTVISHGSNADEIVRACANLANYAMIMAHGVTVRGVRELDCLVSPKPVITLE